MLRGLQSREGAGSAPRLSPATKVQPNSKPLLWFGYSTPVYPWADVLAFRAAVTNYDKLDGLEIIPLSVLEASFNQDVGRATLPPLALKTTFLALPDSGGSRHPLAVAQAIQSLLWSLHSLSPLSFTGTLVTGFRAHPGTPQWIYLKFST